MGEAPWGYKDIKYEKSSSSDALYSDSRQECWSQEPQQDLPPRKGSQFGQPGGGARLTVSAGIGVCVDENSGWNPITGAQDGLNCCQGTW